MLINHLHTSGKISGKTFKTLKGLIIPLGIFLLIASRIILKLYGGNGPADFIAGMCIGLSMVFCITGIIVNRKYVRKTFHKK